MKSVNEPILSAPSELDKFQIEQAIVPLSLGTVDEPILQYFRFFTQKIPTKAAYFLHVVKNFDLLEIWEEKEVDGFVAQFVPDKNIIKELNQKVGIDLKSQLINDIEYDVKDGNPAEEIIAAVEEMKSDLLIIGKRLSLDNSSKFVRKMARICKHNVMVVPENSRNQLKKILVPIDFSDYSGKALELAIAIKNQMEDPVEIEAVHIYTLPKYIGFSQEAGWDAFLQIVENNFQKAFQAFLYTHIPKHMDELKIQLIPKEDRDVTQHLQQEIIDEKIDLVLIGGKGHSKLDRLIMGSVAEGIIERNNYCPMIIVK